MKVLFLVTLALLLLISPTAPANDDKTNEVLIVGEPSPPYLFAQDDQAKGIDVEIIRYIFERLGVNYRVITCPFARCQRMLQTGQASIGLAMASSSESEAYAYFPHTFTRNAEFVLMTNKVTKKSYSATSLAYARDNNFKVGVVRGKPYIQKLWNYFPWRDSAKKEYHWLISPVVGNNNALKMLNRNRINVLPAELKSTLYTAKNLNLNNITHYNFIAFFKPFFNAFSKNSSFSSERYPDIKSLLTAYEKELRLFKELPEYYDIFNWDWSADTRYKRKNTKVTKESSGKTINVGFLAALSGPGAGWGKPGLTGNQLFIDEVNANGGLLVNGVRHPLKMHIYDDKSEAQQALAGAKYLVEQHDVKFINAIGGTSADATHPYLTQRRVIYASLIATDIKPDRPYLIAGGDVTPRIDMLRPWYHKNKNPTLKRWAVVSQNDPIGRSSQAWEVGSAIAEGWNVVYDQHFPIDTTDFSEIVSDILATKPDVISLNLTWPAFVASIFDELHTQGYSGEISANYLNVEANLKQVPLWFHEGAVDSFPLFNDPFWGTPSVQHNFYERWMKRYGPGAPEDVHRTITGIDWDHVIMLKVWAFGAQLAGSFDPDKILEALRAQQSFPTLLGRAMMKGREMWGIENMVSPPIPINETRNGVKRIQTIKRFEEWFQKNKGTIIDVVKSKGFYWGSEDNR